MSEFIAARFSFPHGVGDRFLRKTQRENSGNEQRGFNRISGGDGHGHVIGS